MPLISITGALEHKPAGEAAVLGVCATAAEAASPAGRGTRNRTEAKVCPSHGSSGAGDEALRLDAVDGQFSKSTRDQWVMGDGDYGRDQFVEKYRRRAADGS